MSASAAASSLVCVPPALPYLAHLLRVCSPVTAAAFLLGKGFDLENEQHLPFASVRVVDEDTDWVYVRQFELHRDDEIIFCTDTRTNKRVAVSNIAKDDPRIVYRAPKRWCIRADTFSHADRLCHVNWQECHTCWHGEKRAAAVVGRTIACTGCPRSFHRRRECRLDQGTQTPSPSASEEEEEVEWRCVFCQKFDQSREPESTAAAAVSPPPPLAALAALAATQTHTHSDSPSAMEDDSPAPRQEGAASSAAGAGPSLRKRTSSCSTISASSSQNSHTNPSANTRTAKRARTSFVPATPPGVSSEQELPAAAAGAGELRCVSSVVDSQSGGVDATEDNTSSSSRQFHSLLEKVKGARSDASSDVQHWLRMTNFNNNFGMDFVNVLDDPSFLDLVREMSTGSQHQQSGLSSSDDSVASVLWDEAEATCRELFRGYLPISVGMHTSDLLPHLIGVCEVRHLEETSEELIQKSLWLRPDHRTAVGVLTLPHSYYEMGFVIHSFAMRSGRHLPITTIATDPSFLLGAPVPGDLLTREEQALREIRKTIQSSHKVAREASIKIFLLEPLLVPGGGRTYRSEFLLKLQSLLRQLDVVLVADETISFVRCGAPLFSHTIPGLTPDLVLIGKGLGGSLLMIRESLPETTRVIREFQTGFSLIASPLSMVQISCTLRFLLQQTIADRCKTQGVAMIDVLQRVPGVSARGIGHCLWIDKGLEQLPISACINGRLLPRFDQTAEVISSIVLMASSFTERAKTTGELERARGSSCAVCGDQCRIAEKCHKCDSCTRQYHCRCTKNPRDGPTGLEYCPCGSQLPTA